MRRCGFEAITMTRPFAWLAEPPRSWLSRPPGASPLVGWQPADFVERMPVLLRHPLIERDAPELVLRAFLDQPLILYGHHGDVAGGLGTLASAVEDVNRVREARWCSVGEIAASNYETKLEGTQLSLRTFARRVELEIPAGVDRLEVRLPAQHPGPAAEVLTVAGRPAKLGEPADVNPGDLVEIRLEPADRVDFGAVPAPRRQPLALARRALGESRDRLLPLLPRTR
jgi:hypothetical protein